LNEREYPPRRVHLRLRKPIVKCGQDSAVAHKATMRRRGAYSACPRRAMSRLPLPCLVIVAALEAHKAAVNSSNHHSPWALTSSYGAGMARYELFAHCRKSGNRPPQIRIFAKAAVFPNGRQIKEMSGCATHMAAGSYDRRRSAPRAPSERAPPPMTSVAAK
jgi:hypothetical protein